MTLNKCALLNGERAKSNKANCVCLSHHIYSALSYDKMLLFRFNRRQFSSAFTQVDGFRSRSGQLAPLGQQKWFPNTGPKQITDLNEYCVEAIFQHLDVTSLSNVANTCKDYARIAKVVFKKKKNDFELDQIFPRAIELILILGNSHP